MASLRAFSCSLSGLVQTVVIRVDWLRSWESVWTGYRSKCYGLWMLISWDRACQTRLLSVCLTKHLEVWISAISCTHNRYRLTVYKALFRGGAYTAYTRTLDADTWPRIYHEERIKWIGRSRMKSKLHSVSSLHFGAPFSSGLVRTNNTRADCRFSMTASLTLVPVVWFLQIVELSHSRVWCVVCLQCSGYNAKYTVN